MSKQDARLIASTIDSFCKELQELEDKYKLILTHEDPQGGFLFEIDGIEYNDEGKSRYE